MNIKERIEFNIDDMRIILISKCFFLMKEDMIKSNLELL